MVNKVIMPKLGEVMEEGEIVRWLKKEGEEVKRGEPLLEIATDKAIIEVEAFVSGFLRKILTPEGKEVPVGETIAYITDSMEEEIPGEVKKEGKRKTPALPKLIKASPLAKKLAREYGINLSKVKRTGPEGRIAKKDILKLIKREEGPLVKEVPSEEGIPLSGVRKIIAERMGKSKREIPHFYLTCEVDLSIVAKTMKEEIKEKPVKESEVHLTYTDLLIKACGYGLKGVPQVNSTFKEGKIYQSSQINVGVAIGRDERLVVPIIKNVDRKSLFEIAKERKRLIKRTKENKLSLEELEGSSFTLSNLGMFGIKTFSAIINPPQVCILAIGEIKDRVVTIAREIEIRPIMEMTLSCDHRVINGILGARFLQKVKEGLENHPS